MCKSNKLLARLVLRLTYFISKRRISGMALLILALLQRIFLMSSLMLLLVWLIFFMVLIKLLPILGTMSGKTVNMMVLALICLGNNRQQRHTANSMFACLQIWEALRSVDLTTMTESPAAVERSDVCAVPAAAVVGEAMVAFVLADALIEKFGGDSMDELLANWRASAARTAGRFALPTHETQ